MTPLPQRLADLARRVDANLPKHGDPEAFHAEKSEIVQALKTAAREVEHAAGRG